MYTERVNANYLCVILCQPSISGSVTTDGQKKTISEAEGGRCRDDRKRVLYNRNVYIHMCNEEEEITETHLFALNGEGQPMHHRREKVAENLG